MPLPVLADRQERDAIGILDRRPRRPPRRARTAGRSSDARAAGTMCAGIAGTTIGAAGRTSSGITEGSVAASRYFTVRMPPVAAASAAMNRSAAGWSCRKLVCEISSSSASPTSVTSTVGSLGMRRIAVEQHDGRHAQLGIGKRLQSESRRRQLGLRRGGVLRSPTAACGTATPARRRRSRSSHPTRSRRPRRAPAMRWSCRGPTGRRAPPPDRPASRCPRRAASMPARARPRWPRASPAARGPRACARARFRAA